MRSNIDQQNHKPCFFIYDTDENSLTKIDIPIKDNIFIIEKKIEMEDDFNDLFSTMIKENDEDFTIDFRKNIETAIQKTKLDPITKQIIKEIVYG